jgi:hypothetical protein
MLQILEVQPALFRRVFVAAALLCAADARADILGFGDFSGFTVNQADALAGPTVSPGIIKLTNGAAGESRSIFYNTPQGVAAFTASFTYQAVGTPTGHQFGATFVLQNSSAGAHAVVGNFLGDIATFGYAGDFNPFGTSSVAVSLEYASLSPSSSSTARYQNGGVGGGSSSTSPVDLFSGDPILLTLTYNGSLLHEHLVDATTAASFDTSYLVNIPAIVGGPTAFVGFTANTGTNPGTVDEFFSDFQFVGVPEPSTAAMLAAGTVGLAAAAIRRRSMRRP